MAGRVKQVTRDALLAEVVLDCSGQEVVAVITRESADRLDLREGETAYATIKATEVMIGR